MTGSVLVTLLVGSVALVWPSATEAQDTPPETGTALTARLAAIPVPEPTPEPTPEEAAAAEPTDFPASGPGTFRVAQVRDVDGAGSGRDRTFTVEIEDDLPHDPDAVADQVASVLGDDRGWRTEGWSFSQVDERAQIRILLASPATVDRLCAPLRTFGEVSCRTGDKVVLNVKRWTLGVEYYGDDLEGYRTYLINHEVGHALGKGHVGCPAPGAKAPVMLQQTKGLQGCVANPWP